MMDTLVMECPAPVWRMFPGLKAGLDAKPSRYYTNTMNTNDLWQLVLETLQKQVSQGEYALCLRDSQAVTLDNDVLVIGTETAYAREYLRCRLNDLIELTVADILDRPVRLHFELVDNNGSHE